MDDSKIDGLMEKPYNQWIKYYIKSYSIEEMEDILKELSLELPDEIWEQIDERQLEIPPDGN